MSLYVIEGLDGSGKSTMAKAVVEKLSLLGKDVSFYRFPSTETPAGRTLRRILDGHEDVVDKKALLYLFAGDVHELKWRLGDDLANRRIVVCDRHPLLSAWVYQTDVWSFGDLYTILQPQLLPNISRSFILHVSPALAIERITQRGLKRSLYEEDFVIKAARYQALSQMRPFGPITDLDGHLPIERNAESIINIVLA